MRHKLFISHAEIDKELVKPLIELIGGFFYISKKHIFCSSVPETSVRNACDIADEVISAYKESKFIVYLVTSNYLDRKNCMLEFAWKCNRLDDELYFFRIGDWDFNRLPSLANKTKFSEFDTEGLNELRKKLAKHFKAKKKKEEWINSCKSLIESTAQKKKSEESTFQLFREANEELTNIFRQRHNFNWWGEPMPLDRRENNPRWQ